MSTRSLRGAGLVVVLLATATTGWSREPQVETIRFMPVASVKGEDLFKAYCAHCHGVDGKGHGPQAPVLRVPPADLTTIAARNGGRFVASAVEEKINGWNLVPRAMVDAAERVNAMNTGENAQNVPVMPLFGPLFARLYPQEIRDRIVRMANLVGHVKSMQVKQPPAGAQE